MAAAGSKPTAVHYWLITFVLFSLVFGLMWFLTHRQVEGLRTQAKTAEEKRKTAENASLVAVEQINALKDVMGRREPTVGDANTADATTVIGKAKQELAEASGAEAAAATYSATVAALSERLRLASSERETLRNELARLQASYASLEARANAEMSKEKSARSAAEADRDDVQKSLENKLAEKDQDINTLKRALSDSQAELSDLRDTMKASLKDKDLQITRLETLNEGLTQELQATRRVTFEVPDGRIVQVENLTNSVWINLGSSDNLKEALTFSVYRKDNAGIGKAAPPTGNESYGTPTYGPSDIKGSIEVIKIEGAHLAKCRVTYNPTLLPIAVNDPIYSPVWSPGGSDTFALVGEIDLDGDGKSDREAVREFIRSAGASLDVEIDDEGRRVGKGMNERTRFLIVARIPEARPTDTAERVKVVEAIRSESTALNRDAKQMGVQTISLPTFLAFSGYRPTRRLFIPNSEGEFPLRIGREPVAGTKGFSMPAAARAADRAPEHRTPHKPDDERNRDSLFRGRSAPGP
jgi:hypothetical protein